MGVIMVINQLITGGGPSSIEAITTVTTRWDPPAISFPPMNYRYYSYIPRTKPSSWFKP